MQAGFSAVRMALWAAISRIARKHTHLLLRPTQLHCAQLLVDKITEFIIKILDVIMSAHSDFGRQRQISRGSSFHASRSAHCVGQQGPVTKREAKKARKDLHAHIADTPSCQSVAQTLPTPVASLGPHSTG